MTVSVPAMVMPRWPRVRAALLVPVMDMTRGAVTPALTNCAGPGLWTTKPAQEVDWDGESVKSVVAGRPPLEASNWARSPAPGRIPLGQLPGLARSVFP